VPRVAAVTLIWMGIVGGTAVVPHGDDCHDAACNPVAVEHNAAAHRIGADASGPDGHPQHCLVCHWARAFRPRAEARIVSAPASSADVRIPAVPFTLSAAGPVSQPPLRSPPV
jgi:hypothetical protein